MVGLSVKLELMRMIHRIHVDKTELGQRFSTYPRNLRILELDSAIFRKKSSRHLVVEDVGEAVQVEDVVAAASARSGGRVLAGLRHLGGFRLNERENNRA